MSRPDKARRKALFRQHQEIQRMAMRQRLGLTADELNSLFDYLDRQLTDTACDHTLRLTQQWAREHGQSIESVAIAVRWFGGYCDCEVLANVTPDKFGWPESP